VITMIITSRKSGSTKMAELEASYRMKLILGFVSLAAIQQYTTKPIPDVSQLKGMTVKICPEPSPDPNAVFEQMCDWYANGTIVFTPKVTEPALITESVVRDNQSECYKKGLREWTAGTYNQTGFDGCGPDYHKAIMNQCIKWNDKVSCEQWFPASSPAPITQVQNLVCQSNDDFCEPGCEHAVYQ
jgi:hypothetical protein